MASQKKLRITPRGLMFIAAIVLIVIACIILISVYSCTGKKTPTELTATPEPSMAATPTGTPMPSDATGPVVTDTTAPSSPATDAPATDAPSGTPTVTDTPAPTLKPALDTEPTKTQKENASSGTVNGNDVNLRGGPSTEYVSLGKCNKGDAVTIYGTESGFTFVRTADGKLGYISSQYVSAQELGDAPSGTVTGKVTATELALRSGPSKDSQANGNLSQGAVVYIYFKTGDFYYIEVAATGKKYYVFADYVKAEDSVPKGTPVP